MMSDKLKPCPFCGSKAKLETGEESNGLGLSWHKTYDVICSKRSCICHPDCPKIFTDKNKAIEAWNRRADNGKMHRM